MLVLRVKGNRETMKVSLRGEMNGDGDLFYWLASVV